MYGKPPFRRPDERSANACAFRAADQLRMKTLEAGEIIAILLHEFAPVIEDLANVRTCFADLYKDGGDREAILAKRIFELDEQLKNLGALT